MLQLISNCVTLVVSPTLALYRFSKAWQSLFGCARGSTTGDCDETAIEVVGTDIRDDLELLEIVVGEANEVGEIVAREDNADEARFSLLSRIAVSGENHASISNVYVEHIPLKFRAKVPISCNL